MIDDFSKNFFNPLADKLPSMESKVQMTFPTTMVTMAEFSFLDHLDIERMWLIDLDTVD